MFLTCFFKNTWYLAQKLNSYLSAGHLLGERTMCVTFICPALAISAQCCSKITLNILYITSFEKFDCYIIDFIDN